MRAVLLLVIDDHKKRRPARANPSRRGSHSFPILRHDAARRLNRLAALRQSCLDLARIDPPDRNGVGSAGPGSGDGVILPVEAHCIAPLDRTSIHRNAVHRELLAFTPSCEGFTVSLLSGLALFALSGVEGCLIRSHLALRRRSGVVFRLRQVELPRPRKRICLTTRRHPRCQCNHYARHRRADSPHDHSLLVLSPTSGALCNAGVFSPAWLRLAAGAYACPSTPSTRHA